MLATNIYNIQITGKVVKVVLLCTLGFDEQKREVIVLKGDRKFGKKILLERYLNKKRYFKKNSNPVKHEHLEASQGKYYIRNLCYGLCSNYIWATKPFKVFCFLRLRPIACFFGFSPPLIVKNATS